MDRGDRAKAGLTIVSLVIGGALTVLLDAGRGQLERKQRREDRRAEFQHWSLIDLQEAIDHYTSRTGEVYARLQNERDPSEELREAQRQAEARVIVLKVRVLDGNVRDTVKRYLQASRIAVMSAADSNERARALSSSMKPFNEANEYIGERLRTL